MQGYILIEQSTTFSQKENGIVLFQKEMGILDFLREVSQEVFPFPKFYKLHITGLESVLFASGQEDRERALQIKKILRSAASDMEKKLINIQIVFQGKLIPGDSLWLEYRGRKLPINLIFGNLSRQTDVNGNRFYATSFNLTNGV